MRLDVDESRALQKFVWYWPQTKQVRAFIQLKAKGTSPTMKKISQEIVGAIPFSEGVPLDVQRNKVSQLDSILARVLTMTQAWRNWQVEVNALTPALLEREFSLIN